tara:strand:- start:3502 stop:3747 length:246 start_codon:yes stop_codon:yes gene_type:complete
MVVFRLRREAPVFEMEASRLRSETYHDARALAPGWDAYALEAEWRRWCESEEIEPRKPERHFQKFRASLGREARAPGLSSP